MQTVEERMGRISSEERVMMLKERLEVRQYCGKE